MLLVPTASIFLNFLYFLHFVGLAKIQNLLKIIFRFSRLLYVVFLVIFSKQMLSISKRFIVKKNEDITKTKIKQIPIQGL